MFSDKPLVLQVILSPVMYAPHITTFDCTTFECLIWLHVFIEFYIFIQILCKKLPIHAPLILFINSCVLTYIFINSCVLTYIFINSCVLTFIY